MSYVSTQPTAHIAHGYKKKNDPPFFMRIIMWCST